MIADHAIQVLRPVVKYLDSASIGTRFPRLPKRKKKKSRRSAMVARRFPKAKVASSILVGGMVSFLASGRAEGARPDENQFLMDCVWDSAVG